VVTLFGIPNCDTVKKARTWLADNNIEFTFHDFRKDGLSATQVDTWLADLGCDTLVNKRSTSWKTLSEEVKTSLNDASASSLVLASPTLIKRPLLDRDGSFSVGFKVADYETLFNQ
jgi:arsenate reductase